MDPKIYMCYIIHHNYKKSHKELVVGWNRDRPNYRDENIFRELALYMQIIRRGYKGTAIEKSWNNTGVPTIMNFISKHIAFDNN